MFSRPLLLHCPTPELVITHGAKSQLTQQVLVASGKLSQEPRPGAVPQGQGKSRMLVVSNSCAVFSPLVATEMLAQQECAHVWVVRLLSCHLSPLRSVFAPSDQVFMHTDRFLCEEGRTCAHTGPFISEEGFGGGLFTE